MPVERPAAGKDGKDEGPPWKAGRRASVVAPPGTAGTDATDAPKPAWRRPSQAGPAPDTAAAQPARQASMRRLTPAQKGAHSTAVARWVAAAASQRLVARMQGQAAWAEHARTIQDELRAFAERHPHTAEYRGRLQQRRYRYDLAVRALVLDARGAGRALVAEEAGERGAIAAEALDDALTALVDDREPLGRAVAGQDEEDARAALFRAAPGDIMPGTLPHAELAERAAVARVEAAAIAAILQRSVAERMPIVRGAQRRGRGAVAEEELRARLELAMVARADEDGMARRAVHDAEAAVRLGLEQQRTAHVELLSQQRAGVAALMLLALEAARREAVHAAEALAFRQCFVACVADTCSVRALGLEHEEWGGRRAVASAEGTQRAGLRWAHHTALVGLLQHSSADTNDVATEHGSRAALRWQEAEARWAMLRGAAAHRGILAAPHEERSARLALAAGLADERRRLFASPEARAAAEAAEAGARRCLFMEWARGAVRCAHTGARLKLAAAEEAQRVAVAAAWWHGIEAAAAAGRTPRMRRHSLSASLHGSPRSQQGSYSPHSPLGALGSLGSPGSGGSPFGRSPLVGL